MRDEKAQLSGPVRISRANSEWKPRFSSVNTYRFLFPSADIELHVPVLSQHLVTTGPVVVVFRLGHGLCSTNRNLHWSTYRLPCTYAPPCWDVYRAHLVHFRSAKWQVTYSYPIKTRFITLVKQKNFFVTVPFKNSMHDLECVQVLSWATNQPFPLAMIITSHSFLSPKFYAKLPPPTHAI